MVSWAVFLCRLGQCPEITFWELMWQDFTGQLTLLLPINGVKALNDDDDAELVLWVFDNCQFTFNFIRVIRRLLCMIFAVIMSVCM